ncbi:sulfatase-like hydrolase/transferase, partial [Candidatus Gottesmanbacteria bacterium]|nr:sulfatase-like hydrolase/transferase [Candidatus Gottesmanbacteria bacterium]
MILISFDGLQAKYLHEYGYPLSTTPNLDGFLDKSYLFLKAKSAAPWTVPSHMSVMTSMYPSEHKVVNKFTQYDSETKKGVTSNLNKLTPNAITLAQVLKQNGYTTGGFTGDAGVTGIFGFNQGFDTYFDKQTFGGFDQSVPRALEWLKKNKDKRFFMFLHGYDVHGQHAPVGGFDYRYVEKPYKGKYTGSPKEQGTLREEGLKNGVLNLSAEDIKFWRAVYDEKINRVDTE